jgi:hypothetical protein
MAHDDDAPVSLAVDEQAIFSVLAGYAIRQKVELRS